MAKAPAEIEAGCTDNLLIKELKPWLTVIGNQTFIRAIKKR